MTAYTNAAFNRHHRHASTPSISLATFSGFPVSPSPPHRSRRPPLGQRPLPTRPTPATLPPAASNRLPSTSKGRLFPAGKEG